MPLKNKEIKDINLNPNPSRILNTCFAFYASKVLLTAAKLGVFTLLGNQSMTAEKLGKTLKLHPRGIYDFFDALVSLNFLARDGDGPQGKYKNTADTAYFLDQKKPSYIGGILEMVNDRHFKFWHHLEEGLKTGKPQNEVKYGSKPIFEELYSNPKLLEQFVHAMTGLSLPNFTALTEKFNFSKYKTFCDVGGALGVLSGLVVEKFPQMTGFTFDLPQLEPIAKKYLKKHRFNQKIKALSGNYLTDKLPTVDVIFMSQILHDLNLENKNKLIRSAFHSLSTGGVLIVIDAIIDDPRRKNTFGMLMSLNMLIEFGDAFDYSFSDFKTWCEKAGFKSCKKIVLNNSYSALAAYK